MRANSLFLFEIFVILSSPLDEGGDTAAEPAFRILQAHAAVLSDRGAAPKHHPRCGTDDVKRVEIDSGCAWQE
jgi:hypothetical protein